MADDSSVGTVAWASVDNAKVSDNARSSVGATGTTHYLKATNFGFTIPSGSTINGIVVEIERADAGDGTTDSTIKLVKGGVVSGTNKSAGATWPGSEQYDSFGGSSDLWGNTLTYSDVNASTFGVVVSAATGASGSPLVDHIRITVHYTDPVKEFSAAGASTSSGSVVFKLVRKFAAAGASTSSGSIVFEIASNNYVASGSSISSGSIVFTVDPHKFIAAGASTSSGSISFKLTRKATFAGGSVSGGSIFFETVYIYQTPQEVTAHMSASLREVTPSTPDPQTLLVRVDGSADSIVALLGVEHGIEPGNGTEVIHGDLILTLAEDMPAGTYVFTAKPIDEPWDASLVTYATQPSVRATTATTSESGLVAGDEVTIDITDILDESVSLEGTTGQQWFGLQLTVDGTEEIVFWGAYSVQTRPIIRKEVSRPPVAPFNPRPTSGLHVSELKPYFAWDFRDLDKEDTLSMIHFQLDSVDDFETPDYDSGEVASTTSIFDSNSPPTGSAAFSDLTNTNTYYWRARHADSHGLWSDWSDPQEFTVTTKGTFTADATPTVPTPTISWSLSVTQQAYYVSIEALVGGTWITHWEQPWTTGTATEVTVPNAYALSEDVEYRRTIRVTDTTDRASLTGDPAYYEDVETFSVEIVMV